MVVRALWIVVLLCAHASAAQAPPGGGTTVPKAAAEARVRPALAIGAAVAPDGRLWVVGLDGDGRLALRTGSAMGGDWGAPRQLDTGGDKPSADGENRPKIAFGPDRQVVISYTRPLAKPYTGEVRLLRSDDGGASFAPPVTVHQDRQVITHRFESLAFDASGVLHTVWIDKRDQVQAAREAGSANRRSAYRGAAIYRNESRDAGRSFGSDRKLADHSCECCRIALAPTPEGGIAALWRHVFAPNIRDHAFAILGEPPPIPVRATYDDWKLDACPHHGPGLAPASGGGYHAVWFGEKAGKAGVRYGRLGANGQPLGTVRELPDARAEHADIVSRGRTVAIAWRSFDGDRTRLRAWWSADDGATFILHELAATSDDSDHPRLLSTPSGIVVLWRTAKDIHAIPLPH